MISKLIQKKEVAEGTIAFTFERPEGFNYKAGQFLEITLINPPETDDEGTTRAFSIVSAPFEEHLTIATRLRDSAFKRVLRDLAPSTEVEIAGPFGSFVLHSDADKPAVFLIGGIGITPVRSIFVEASHAGLPHQLYLFYANRRPEDAPFLDELRGIQNPHYTFIPTMTAAGQSQVQWQGETGRIDGEMLKRYIPDLKVPIYYAAGPAAMVKAMRETLNALGIDDDFIRTEEFSGY